MITWMGMEGCTLVYCVTRDNGEDVYMVVLGCEICDWYLQSAMLVLDVSHSQVCRIVH